MLGWTFLGLLALVLLPVSPVIVPLAVWFFNNAAKNKNQASYPEEETLEFVVTGGRLFRVLDNLKGGWHWEGGSNQYPVQVGKYTDKQILKPDGTVLAKANTWYIDTVLVEVTEAIVPGNPKYRPKTLWKKMRKFLREHWGFYWVSLFYPLRKIHEFNIWKARLVGTTGLPIGERIQTDPEMVPVSYLLRSFPRPILVKEIEFKDRFTANLLVLANFLVVVPKIPVFILKDEFFQQLEALVANAVITYCRNLPVAEFIEGGAMSPDGFFMEVISPSNLAFLTQVGVVAVSAEVIDIELGDEEQQKALRALELAELQGRAQVKTADLAAKARVIQAQGEAEAVTVVGNAEAAVLAQKVSAAGVSATVAEQIKQGMGNLKPGVVFAPGGNAGFMVSIPPANGSSSTPTPTTPPASPPTPTAPPASGGGGAP